MLKRGNPKYNYTLNPYQFRYGNYVGHGWSDGKEQSSVTEPTVEPVDYLDEQAMHHDMDSANAKTTLDLAQADLKFAYKTIGSGMVGTVAGVGVGAQGLSRVVTGLMEAGYSYATALSYAEALPPIKKSRIEKAIKYEPKYQDDGVYQNVYMGDAMVDEHGIAQRAGRDTEEVPTHQSEAETIIHKDTGKPTGKVALRDGSTRKIWANISKGKDGQYKVTVTDPKHYIGNRYDKDSAFAHAREIEEQMNLKGNKAMRDAFEKAAKGKLKGSSVSKDAHDIMSLQKYRLQPRHKRMMAERKVKAGKWGPAFKIFLTCGFLPGHIARKEIAATLKKYGVHL